jgi:hypothetical protein
MTIPKIENVVFCDGIRAEIGGKHLIIGAFAPELNVSEIPSIVPVGIWMSIAPTSIGDLEAEIKLKHPNGDENTVAKLKGSLTTIAKSALVLPQLPISVSAPGEYKFSIKFLGGKWQTLGVIKMNLTPAAVAN